MMKVLTSLLAVAANAWTVDKMHRPQGRVADPDGLLKNPDAIEDALARRVQSPARHAPAAHRAAAAGGRLVYFEALRR